MAKTTEQKLMGYVYGSFVNGEASAITKGQIVKLGTTEGEVLKVTAITDVAIGLVASESAAADAQVAIHLFGPIDKSTVDTGNTIVWGNYVGAGATVAGTVALVTPAVGNKKVIGIAIPLTTRTATETVPFIMLPQDINLATS